MAKRHTIASNTKDSPDWYKRLFAWMMAHGNAKYEEEIADRKRA
ncbi:hypothetical protein VB735_33505 [Halotia wernerae UHCC 0503]|nr:hypothetical protein [Halotia wernerae UHCC 0503]